MNKMRRSRRNQAKADLYKPAPLLIGNNFINHLGSGTEFRRQIDYINAAKKEYPTLMGIHNQGYNPFCALFSITTAVEISQKRKWSKEEKNNRKKFCMNNGLQSGDALERTLANYAENFPFDMTYKAAFNMAAAGKYTGGAKDPQKTYGNANDLIKGLQEDVVVCCVSCADVSSKYRLHGKKCSEGDWHAITCIAYIKLNRKPTFVFKDTNKRDKNASSIVFKAADEVFDAELELRRDIGGRDPSMFGTGAYDKVRKMVTSQNKFVITEMFIVKAKNIAMVTVEPVKKKPVEDMTDQLKKMAIDTEEEIQAARTRRGRKKLSQNRRVNKENLVPKKKKGKIMTLSKYRQSVKKEVEDMQKLLKDSAEQREKSITDSLIGRGKPEEPQRTSIKKTLQACVCVESNGSGSIVTHNNETFVLTNQHVALKIGTIKFIMWIDGKIGYAETYWVDKRRDIGKMRIIEKPIDKVISSLSIHTKNVKKGQLLVQIHNPYHWEKDRTEIMGHFPFTVETRNIFPGTKNDEFSHSSTEGSSVYFGSSGSPLIYRDPSTGILGGVVGIHKQWDPNQKKDKKYQGVLINNNRLRVLPQLKF